MKHAKPYAPAKLWLPLLGIIFLFSSCAHINSSHHFAYAPSAINAPFLKEKNQLRLSGNITMGEGDEDNSNSFSNYGKHLRAAYSITDHFGVTAVYTTSKEKDSYNPSFPELSKTIAYRRSSGEISAGYFASVNKKKSLYLECYGGYGPGRNSITESYEYPDTAGYAGGFFNNNYHLIYIQPAIVLHHEKLLQIGISLRTTIIKFGKASTNYGEDVLRNNNVRLYRLNKEPYIFFQPTLSFRIPLSKRGKLNLNLEATRSYPLSGKKIYTRENILLLGLTYSPLSGK
ncbi:MAG: hypothetical protein QM768_11840 [Agriterribacter sp.]